MQSETLEKRVAGLERAIQAIPDELKRLAVISGDQRNHLLHVIIHELALPSQSSSTSDPLATSVDLS